MILPVPEAPISRSRRRWRPVGSVLGFFDSVWVGVILAALLFVYCSIGSGFPWVRQLPAFEMTEFQWFHWWPFTVLTVLLCVTMTTVTVRRVPLRWVNAGVWTIHTGVVVLVLGSWYYFGTKIEGDAPVFRRHVRIERPGLSAPTLLALPGAEVVGRSGADSWKFEIQSTNSDWPILSDGHEGERTYAVNVQVSPPDGPPFVRQLLAGYPDFTEDVIPGKGRAIKSLGRKLVDEQLKLVLEYEPQTSFHVMSTWALFVRKVGDTEWIERKIEGLPRYNDRIASREQVFVDSDTPIRPQPLDITVSPAPGGDALARANVRVTGYLSYAQMDREWRDGGEQLNPVAQVSLLSDRSSPSSFELVALDPTHSVGADGTVQFVWLESADALQALPTDPRALLGITVPGANVSREVPISQAAVSPDGAFVPIEGTDFSYRITNLQDRLLIPGSSRSVSIAFVDVKTPEGQFTRWVADRPEVSRDVPAGDDAHGMAASAPAMDARIQMTYRPSSAPVILAGYPGGLRLIFNGRGGRAVDREVRVGEPAEVLPGLQVRVDGLWPRAVPETKPRIIPENARQQKVDEAFAMIRLEVDSGRGVDARWLRFNSYALPNEEYAYGGRFSYLPERFRLADGTVVEVLFSRERVTLPAPIVLEEFALDTHIGGYSGSVSTIRNYVSQLRFFDGAKWTDPNPIAVNQPTDFGGFWYFQSSWDRPPQGNASGGMNYTGLGIGNRQGVYVQLAGCCLMVAGLIFAFYVKPVLKRRRAEQQRAKAGFNADSVDGDAADFATFATREAVRV